MPARLRIGEAARLLGVTPKTVRHYHRIGLLPEPERGANGYRLYDAAALVRLQRIRRLQALGFSLGQVRDLLGDASDEQSLRDVLRGLLAELTGQLAFLEARRARVERLLAGDASLAFEQAAEPPTLRLVRDRLQGQLPEISEALWEQESRIWAMLDGFTWPAGYEEWRATLIHHLVTHPDQLRQWHRLAEQLNALAGLPEDDPAVAGLAADYAGQRDAFMLPAEITARPPWDDGPFADVLAELLNTHFSPAQRRFVASLKALWDGKSGGRP